MNREEILHAVLSFAAAVAAALILYFLYRAWKVLHQGEEERKELQASADYRDRVTRIRRTLMPFLRPLSWKRIPLDKETDLPHIQNKPIDVHLDAPITILKKRRWVWRRDR